MGVCSIGADRADLAQVVVAQKEFMAIPKGIDVGIDGTEKGIQWYKTIVGHLCCVVVGTLLTSMACDKLGNR